MSATIEHLTPLMLDGVEEVCGSVEAILTDEANQVAVTCLKRYYADRRNNVEAWISVTSTTVFQRLTRGQIFQLYVDQERRFFVLLGAESFADLDNIDISTEEGKTTVRARYRLLAMGYILASPEPAPEVRQATLADATDRGGPEFAAALERASAELDGSLADGVIRTWVEGDPREYLTRQPFEQDEPPFSIRDAIEACVHKFVLTSYVDRWSLAPSWADLPGS